MANPTTTPPHNQPSASQLDHIIILLSPNDFTNLPSWLTSNFTIIEGGTHSKGTSHNKLIIFKDGTYLELFSWTDPQPAEVEPYSDFPSWADKPEGCIIDWALTGPDADETYDRVQGGLKALQTEQGETLDFTYDPPKTGGRRRKDGKELRWATIRPRQSDPKRPMSIDVPFFCHDITQRVLRVPNRNEDDTQSLSEITSHPCGATGIAGLVIEVPVPHLERCTRLYEAILGADQQAKADRREGATVFQVSVPDPVADEQRSTTVHLQIPDEDHRFSISMPGTSVRRLVLFTDVHDRRGEQLDGEGFGTRINLC